MEDSFVLAGMFYVTNMIHIANINVPYFLPAFFLFLREYLTRIKSSSATQRVLPSKPNLAFVSKYNS